MLALHLAKELCRTDEDGEHWVSVMRKVPVLPSVLSAVELSLRSKHNLYFTEAALHLLLTLARTPQVNTRPLTGFSPLLQGEGRPSASTTRGETDQQGGRSHLFIPPLGGSSGGRSGGPPDHLPPSPQRVRGSGQRSVPGEEGT